VRPGSPIDPQDTQMASADTLAALQQQRQALEASNQPQAQKKLDAKVAAAATPRG
jgi:multidrug efflux system membrane fusion protein